MGVLPAVDANICSLAVYIVGWIIAIMNNGIDPMAINGVSGKISLCNNSAACIADNQCGGRISTRNSGVYSCAGYGILWMCAPHNGIIGTLAQNYVGW